MGMGINCCRKCAPPKRQLGCHATCEEYKKEKEKYEEDKKKLNEIKRAKKEKFCDFY